MNENKINNDETWTSSKSFDSFAKEIWKSRKDYVKYARGLMLSEDDAEDLFVKTGLYLIKNPEKYNPKLSPLNYFFKKLMEKMKKDLFRHANDIAVARSQGRYNYSGKDDSFQTIEPLAKNKRRELKSFQINSKDPKIVSIVTKSPCKIFLDTIVFIAGIENTSKETKNNFRNKHGDKIKVKEIISENRFVIELFFDHEIDDTNDLGESLVIGLEERAPMMKPDEKPIRPDVNSEEEKNVLKIQMRQCMARLSTQEKKIFELNMIPNHQINNSRPMITSRIAEQLNMAAGTVGEILARAKKSFARCMMANEGIGA